MILFHSRIPSTPNAEYMFSVLSVTSFLRAADTISPSLSAALLYFGLMTYIVLAILNEVRPMWYYVLSGVLFVLSQLDYFLLSKVICNVSPALLSASSAPTYGWMVD